MQIKNERRVIHRLKTLSEKKAKLEESLKEKREELIRKQKEVTGDEQFDSRPTSHVYD